MKNLVNIDVIGAKYRKILIRTQLIYTEIVSVAIQGLDQVDKLELTG